MPSHFAWIDFSDAERQRMLDVVRLFREQDTRDELGIGTIRDAFADHFFPGTSTIQTRARYMLFVPWVYRALERKQVPSAKMADYDRAEELKLIQTLRKAGETEGIIGVDAGDRLQRLPSTIYWAGLGAWGIRLFPGSQDQYHRSLDGWYARRRNLVVGDDKEPVGGRPAENWHPGLPPPPAGWPEKAGLELSREEALYLQERLVCLHRDSLLGCLVRADAYIEAEHFWHHPIVSALPETLRLEIDHARNFSETIHGAALVYNLMLAEARGNAEWVETYRRALADWRDRMVARRQELGTWYRDFASFWGSRPLRSARIPITTRDFVNEWCRLVFTGPGPTALAEDETAQALIRHRELRLKRNRARLANPRALEVWGGASGIARLEYRWSNVKVLVHDILAGLQREAERSA
ncbi:MAG: DUF6361 family protein [Bacteroidota bacterium]